MGPPAEMVAAGSRARILFFVEHLRFYHARAWALCIVT